MARLVCKNSSIISHLYHHYICRSMPLAWTKYACQWHASTLIKHLTIIILIFFFLFSNLQAGVGTKAGNFLKIGSSARAFALGEAYVSLVDDPSALYWNPAGLSFSQGQSILFSYNKWFEDIGHGFVGINSKQYPWGAFGFGVTYLSIGSIEAYDQYDRRIGSVEASDMAISIGYGKFIEIMQKDIDFGITYKLIRQNMDDVNAKAQAIDTGCMLHFFDYTFNVGVCVQNLLSTKMKFYEDEADLERVYKLGMSYQGELSYDKEFVISYQTDFEESNTRNSLGCELILYDMFSLRSGYRERDLGNGLSAGFGVWINDIIVDYAITDYGEFDKTHMLTLTMEIE